MKKTTETTPTSRPDTRKPEGPALVAPELVYHAPRRIVRVALELPTVHCSASELLARLAEREARELAELQRGVAGISRMRTDVRRGGGA